LREKKRGKEKREVVGWNGKRNDGALAVESSPFSPWRTPTAFPFFIFFFFLFFFFFFFFFFYAVFILERRRRRTAFSLLPGRRRRRRTDRHDPRRAPRPIRRPLSAFGEVPRGREGASGGALHQRKDYGDVPEAACRRRR
jgi:flagellar biosynthesis/type III secretory pathway M-ring protein FliF/YscJ